MKNANAFREKIKNGIICIGSRITFTDPTVTEALCTTLDYVWIDMEHTALTVESVQSHILATRGSDTAAFVRVTTNDPNLIKPVLDIGADSAIVPMIRSAEEAERAVKACLYPPDGIRGFGPRSPSGYGQEMGADFCKRANETVIPMVQIEHIDAINCLDEILDVPGLAAVEVAPYDLSGTMGLMAQPDHPEVVSVMESAIQKSREKGILVGTTAWDAAGAINWIEKGAQWLMVNDDFGLMLMSANRIAKEIRDYTQKKNG